MHGMSDEQENTSWLHQINGLIAVGGIALLIAFLPALGGGDVRALPLLIGVLLIIGGVIVNAIKSRP
jgi:hypothetical protein